MYVAYSFDGFGKIDLLQLSEIQKLQKKAAAGTLTQKERDYITFATTLNLPRERRGVAGAVDAIKGFAKAVGQVVKVNLNPKTAFDYKKQFRAGKNVGRSLEKVVVMTNPLNRPGGPLEKFNKAGIKAGGVGKLLGRTGEKARKNPLAATAIVYSIVTAISKGLVGKAATAAKGLVGSETVVSGAAGLASKMAGGKEIPLEYTGVGDEKLQTVSANMITPQNIALFIGLGTLTTIGYLLYQKRS